MERRIITTEGKLANLLKISEKSVREKFKNERVEAGKYDLIKCFEKFLENMKGKDDELKELEIERKRLKNDILKNKYHKVEDVERIVMDMLSNFKSKIMAIPIKLSQELESNEVIKNEDKLKCQELIRKQLDEALSELTEYEYKEVDDGTEDS